MSGLCLWCGLKQRTKTGATCSRVCAGGLAFKLRTYSPEDHLWFYTERRGDDDCWLFCGPRTTLGYGRLRVRGEMIYAHRFSLELASHGHRPPDHLQVAHSCDTPSCVNPAHLFVCDSYANVMDSIRKGRWAASHPEMGGLYPTHCKHGHEFTPQNTYVCQRSRNGRTYRRCRICDLERQRKAREQRRISC